MRRVFGFIFGALCALPSSANSESTITYGSFLRAKARPEILYYIGEIENGDYFDLRRALRDHAADTLVLASEGGLVSEALQIAATISDNAVSTFIPRTAICASACSFIFLAGKNRIAAGDLGVHQFYGSSPQLEDRSKSFSDAQFTTSEIIGFLNEFGTPPFVFEKMFSTVGIYFFDTVEIDMINRIVEGAETVGLTNAAAQIGFDSLLMQVENSIPPAREDASSSSRKRAPSKDSASLEEQAAAVGILYNMLWSDPGRGANDIAPLYADQINFYGKVVPKSLVIEEKRRFSARWPLRDYKIEPSSMVVQCTWDGCELSSIVRYRTAAPTRGASAGGRATWNLLLSRDDSGHLVIVSENGRVISRD